MTAMSVEEILNWLEERLERRHDELAAVGAGVPWDSGLDGDLRSWRADYWDYREHGGLLPEEVAGEASPYGYGSKAFNRLIREAVKKAQDPNFPTFHGDPREEFRAGFLKVMGLLEAGAGNIPGLGSKVGVDQMRFSVPKVCEFIYKTKTPPVTPEFLEAVSLYVEGPKERNKPKASLAEDDKESFLHIIGALLGFFFGRVPGVVKHPEVKSEAKMIEALVLHYKGFRGVSKRSLEQKFADAKRLLEEDQTTASEE